MDGNSLLICGAGATGIAAAISAARAGADVLLIEQSHHPGGTVANSLIHTLAGLYDSSGNMLNAGLPAELISRLSHANADCGRRRMGRTWVFNVCPNVYRCVVAEWIQSESRIKMIGNTIVRRVETEPDESFQLEAVTGRESSIFRAPALVDATGSAELVRLIDPHLVEDDGAPAAGGLIFRMRGVAAESLVFPQNLAVIRALRKATADRTLPVDCANAWIDSGVFDDEVFVKLAVPLHGTWRDSKHWEAVCRRAREARDATVAFLGKLPQFAGAQLTQTGYLGVRDGGRIRGEYCLTKSDVLNARQFDDAACKCSWPIEYWDSDHGVSMEYLSGGEYYEIPMRSLRLPDHPGVWAAGKCLSADRYAQSSARVAGCCWAMGEAVGIAAAANAEWLPFSDDSSRTIGCQKLNESRR